MINSFGSYWKPASFGGEQQPAQPQPQQQQQQQPSLAVPLVGGDASDSSQQQQRQPAGAVYSVLERAERRMRDAERRAQESVTEARMETSRHARALTHTQQALADAERRAHETERRAQVSIADAWELATRRQVAWGVQSADGGSVAAGSQSVSAGTAMRQQLQLQGGAAGPSRLHAQRQPQRHSLSTSGSAIGARILGGGPAAAAAVAAGSVPVSEIHAAASAGNLSAIIREIDRRGPDVVHHLDARGRPPLWLAAARGRKKTRDAPVMYTLSPPTTCWRLMASRGSFQRRRRSRSWRRTARTCCTAATACRRRKALPFFVLCLPLPFFYKTAAYSSRSSGTRRLGWGSSRRCGCWRRPAPTSTCLTSSASPRFRSVRSPPNKYGLFPQIMALITSGSC